MNIIRECRLPLRICLCGLLISATQQMLAQNIFVALASGSLSASSAEILPIKFYRGRLSP
jgi:hypothetical protein